MKIDERKGISTGTRPAWKCSEERRGYPAEILNSRDRLS
jgi:hypothetical protein